MGSSSTRAFTDFAFTESPLNFLIFQAGTYQNLVSQRRLSRRRSYIDKLFPTEVSVVCLCSGSFSPTWLTRSVILWFYETHKSTRLRLSWLCVCLSYSPSLSFTGTYAWPKLSFSRMPQMRIRSIRLCLVSVWLYVYTYNIYTCLHALEDILVQTVLQVPLNVPG